MEITNYNKIYPTEKFPLKKASDTYFGPVYGDQAIRVSILTILMTRLGERVCMPSFGSRIHELVFEQNNRVFEVKLESYVTAALRLWEPRISVQSVSVIHQRNENKVQICLSFVIRRPGEVPTTFTFQIDRQSGNIDFSSSLSRITI